MDNLFDNFAFGADKKTKSLFDLYVNLTRIAADSDRYLLAYGGFTVDLAVGRMTRKHDDLDLAVSKEDFNWLREKFIELGFEISNHEGMNSDYTFIAQRGGLPVDVISLFIKKVFYPSSVILALNINFGNKNLKRTRPFLCPTGNL